MDGDSGSTAIILGAGFSAGAGIPLCCEIRATAERLVEQAYGDVGPIRKGLEYWRSVEARLSDPNSIEDLFTYAQETLLAAGGQHEAEVFRSTLPTLIAHALYDGAWEFLVNDLWLRQGTNCYRQFLDPVFDAGRDRYQVVTTNYDTIVECAALGRADLIIDYGRGLMLRPYHPERELLKPVFPVHKIHGSLNWLTCINGACPASRAGRVRTAAFDPRWAPVCFDPSFHSCPVCHQRSLRPLIVPPLRCKQPQALSMFSDIMDRARQALTEASTWWVVGLAMNDYDSYIRDCLLRPAIEEAACAKSVIVVDPSGASLSRIEGFLDSFGKKVKTTLHQATFSDALARGAFCHQTPPAPQTDRRAARLQRTHLDLPETACPNCGSLDWRVTYDRAYIDEDYVETRGFSITCAACQSEWEYACTPAYGTESLTEALRGVPFGEFSAVLGLPDAKTYYKEGVDRRLRHELMRYLALKYAADMDAGSVRDAILQLEGPAVAIRCRTHPDAVAQLCHVLPLADYALVFFHVEYAEPGSTTIATEVRQFDCYLNVRRYTYNDQIVRTLYSLEQSVGDGQYYCMPDQYDAFMITPTSHVVLGFPKVPITPAALASVPYLQCSSASDLDALVLGEVEIPVARDTGDLALATHLRGQAAGLRRALRAYLHSLRARDSTVQSAEAFHELYRQASSWLAGSVESGGRRHAPGAVRSGRLVVLELCGKAELWPADPLAGSCPPEQFAICVL